MLDHERNLPATLRKLSDIVAEYDQKSEAIPQLVADLKTVTTAAEMGACIGATYAGQIWERGAPSLSERNLRKNLLQSAWQHVYNGLQLDRIAPASDRSKFEMAFKDPAPFTLDNIRATFGKYIVDPRTHILRGLAECFSQLDPAFKSHDRMKIGVKGLPKRIILTSVDDYGSGYGSKRLQDTINALRVYNGQPHLEWAEFRKLLEGARRGGSEFDAMELRRFANGNGHLIFKPEALRQINLALAEFYGEVLADCPEARPERAQSTEVSKDLQFYCTPTAAADQLVSEATLREGMRVLEPSCGDGAILEALRRRAMSERLDLRAVGVEYDSTRAEQARGKGFSVHTANFLQVTPRPDFDLVLMNPPFYGKHYQKHVQHALKFLKPGGALLAILPITAATDHNFIDPGRGYDRWRDLPIGSFSESGTNINTGIAKFWAPK